MKKMNKIMITALGAVLGMSVGTASAADISGSIYGGLQQVSPSEGDATMKTYGIGKANITGELAEKDGWSAKGTIKLEMTANTSASGNVKTDEAFLTLSGPVDIIAGITNIGGANQGGSYTSDQGSSNGNQLGYNFFADYALIGVGTNFGLTVAYGSTGETTNKTDSKSGSTMELLYKLSGVENLSLGFSYESKSDSTKTSAGTTTKTESGFALGVAYKVGNIEPFLNYASKTTDSGVKGSDALTATATNIGLDLHELGPLGLTVGVEVYDSGVDGADAVNYMYLATQVPLGPGTFTFHYHNDGTKDAEESKINLEFGISI